MASENIGPDRRLVPRWRSVVSTWALGELAPIQDAVPDPLGADLLQDKLREWKANPALGFASDLIGAGVLVGRVDVVREAAEWLLAQGDETPLTLRRLASHALGGELSTLSPEVLKTGTFQVVEDRSVELVRSLRARLRDYPRNALAWIELARCYAALGLKDQAERAVEAGVTVSPDSRYVLRSAARFFVHVHDSGRAQRILRRSPVTLADPWLLAAEIAISTDLGGRKNSRYWREGRRLIERESIPDHHISELAGALGTVELLEGDTRSARRLFDKALSKPTENALAQAEWAAKALGKLSVEARHLSLPRSYEARALRELRDGNWAAAASAAAPWLDDEPFSSRPAVFGSFVSMALLDDPVSAQAFALKGLVANPGDNTLLNNLAVALAVQGQVAEAREVFARIAQRDDDDDRPVWRATAGLLDYRGQRPEAGRQAYLEALEGFRLRGADLQHDRASIYLVIEELRQPRGDTETFVQGILRGLKNPGDRMIRALLQRVIVAIENRSDAV